MVTVVPKPRALGGCGVDDGSWGGAVCSERGPTWSHFKNPCLKLINLKKKSSRDRKRDVNKGCKPRKMQQMGQTNKCNPSGDTVILMVHWGAVIEPV